MRRRAECANCGAPATEPEPLCGWCDCCPACCTGECILEAVEAKLSPKQEKTK